MTEFLQIPKVFSDDLLLSITKYIGSVPWKYGWASNKNVQFTHWNHDIAHAPTINGLDVSHKLPDVIKEGWDYIQKHHTGPQTLLRCYTNAHTYGVEGYPHTDSRRIEDNTLVVYMNKFWDRDWGGETMIYNGYDISHAELPYYNKGLVFPGHHTHQARSVTRVCPAQRITLMFKFAPVDIDKQRDVIQRFLTKVGADKIPHSKGKLNRHLLNTYDILKVNGFDNTTCTVGALHSIIGTNVFTHKTLQDSDALVSEFGSEISKLVRLFSQMNRPSTLEAALKTKTNEVLFNDGHTELLDETTLNILCAVEAANLSDQNSLKKYENLLKLITK